jgi:hypothetical protein
MKSTTTCEFNYGITLSACHLTIYRNAIHRGATVLNALGKAMGAEIDSQNKHIDRIIKKTDKVDDQIAVNRARLDRIR